MVGRNEREYVSRRPKIKKYRGSLGVVQALGMVLFFPLMYIYLEVVFHWYMKLDMKYTPVLIGFAISLGLVLALFTMNFGHRVNKCFAYIITCLSSLVFCIEMVCKTVLQQYYQLLSSADTAANNKLTDYMDAIIDGIVVNLLGIFLMLIPVILIFILGSKFYRFRRKNIRLSAFVLGGAVLTHILGLAVINLPWSGDFTPKMLYGTDTNVDDQVEQLGIMTMLRLDVKHSLFGVDKTLEGDFDNLSVPVINGDTTPITGENPTPNPENVGDSSATPVVETATPEPTQTVDTSPNVMDIDFDSLISNSKNDNVTWLHKYFQSLTPTNKNEYTGMFKDYNVIFITAEGLSKYAIDPVRTPTLYKLASEGFVFENFYTPLHFTSTSGGEFRNLVGLYPKNGMPISMKQTGIDETNLYFSLANQLNRLGYKSIGFHNNNEMYGRRKSHSNLGYDWRQGGEGYEMEKTSSGKNIWPQSDVSLMEQSIDAYINEDKFNVYYLTVSGHMPYNFSGDMMAIKNKSEVESLPYSDTTKAYLAANLELEKAMKYLLERLEQAGKLENTLIVLSPDHIPYSDVDILEELAGKKFGGEDLENLKESDLDFDVYKNTLIMWSGSMKEPIKVDKICGQVDILPTVSNLLGLEYDSRLIIGSDIMSDSTPLVIFSSSSWLTDKGLYNRFTGEFTLADGVTMPDSEKEEYVSVVKKIVSYKLQASVAIVDEDYYNILFPKNN